MFHAKILPACLLTALLLCSCSGDGDEEQGAIDTMTKEVGQEAVRMIKTPLDKAQAVADQEEERVQELEDRVDQ